MILVLVLVLDSLLNKTSKRIELKLYIAYLELYPTGNNHLESILGRVHFDHGRGSVSQQRVDKRLVHSNQLECFLRFLPQYGGKYVAFHMKK